MDLRNHVGSLLERPVADFLEAEVFKAADLLKGGEVLLPTLEEAAQDGRGEPFRNDLVGIDAEGDEGVPLFLRNLVLLPLERRGEDAELQIAKGLREVYEEEVLGLLGAIFVQLLLERLCERGFEVYFLLPLADDFPHAEGHIEVRRDEVARMADVVLGGLPEEIEEEQVVFAFAKAGSSPDHLREQRIAFCRAKHHDAINGGLVEAFREEHGVADDINLAVVEILKDFSTVRAVCVDFRSVEAALVEHFGKGLGKLHKREEHHGMPSPALPSHDVRNLFEIRFEGVAEILRLEIPCRYLNAGDIEGEGDVLDADVAEVMFLDCLRQVVLEGDFLVKLGERAMVGTVRGGGHAEHLGLTEVVEDFRIGLADAVVRLVHDDEPERAFRELLEAVVLRECLDARDDHGLVLVRCELRFFKRTVDAARRLELVLRLIQEFFAMGEDEDALPFRDSVSGDVGEYDGFPASRGHDENQPLVLLEVCLDGADSLLLVRSEFHDALLQGKLDDVSPRVWMAGIVDLGMPLAAVALLAVGFAFLLSGFLFLRCIQFIPASNEKLFATRRHRRTPRFIIVYWGDSP